MIRYFQLTPEILLEYVCDNDPKLKGNEKDLSTYENSTMLLKSNAFKSKYLCFKNDLEKLGINSFSNFVLPINNTDTQFVVANSKYQKFFSRANISNRFLTNSGNKLMYEDTNYDSDILSKGISCNLKFNKCIIHFTSRNYFGAYDSLIFQTYAYINNKEKLYFSSFIFRKTSNLELNSEYFLYNEKLYTTHIEFDIPSVYSILKGENEVFSDALKKQNINLLENTTIGVNVYGVREGTIGIDNYEKLKVIKINSIHIPYYNTLDEINIDIFEAPDGDYFYINPSVGSAYLSFVDYIEKMREDIRSYVIMHELCLKEVWVDIDNTIHSEITHKELHIIDINEDDEDFEISKKFDNKIKFRPICIRSDKDCVATIIDTIKIINTVDGSSYEATGSLDITNPYRYGKKLKRLDFKTESRPIVNVYNKNVSLNSNKSGINSSSTSEKGVVVLNKGGGFTIENMTQNITSFMESTNIGVSIVELSPEEM